MEIKLIQETNNSDELIRNVWKVSRPASGETDPNDLIKIDAPISDFIQLTIHVKCSILEREIFTSMNDAVIWAQTSRVNNPFDWNIDENIETDYNEIERLYQKMKLDSKTESQDNYRMHMPLAATTEFTCKISIRSLYKLAKYFEYLSEFHPYFKSSSDEIINTIGNRAELMNKYSKIYPLSEFSVFQSGVIGHYLTISLYAPIAFRAQVIRHSNISVSDGLLGIIKTGDPWSVSIGKEIPIQISANVEIWKNILRSRSCWMAQHGLWSKVITEVSKQMDFGESILPCKNSCPYNEDAKLRYTDKDPGSPCPKHAILIDKKLSDDDIADINKQFENEKRPKFWRKIICQVRK